MEKLTPKVASSKRDLKVEEKLSLKFKKERGDLYVSPNGDLILLLSDFLNLELKEDGDRPYLKTRNEELPPSLFGLLRAFYLLLLLDPSLFKKLLKLTKELSFLYEDEYTVPFAVIFEEKEEKRELYLTMLTLLKSRLGVKSPVLASKFGIFSNDKEEEERKMVEYLKKVNSLYEVKPFTFLSYEDLYESLTNLEKLLK